MTADGRVRIEPSATAMVWHGVGLPHVPVLVPDVVLAAHDVLLRVELASVCGSDVHTVLGHRPGPSPSVLGHEYVGRVAAIGDGGASTQDGTPLRVGERVVGSIMARCGACDRCRRGTPQKCRRLVKYGHEAVTEAWTLNGGFASHVHVRAGTSIVAVDEEADARLLVPLSCGTATAWAALDRAAQVVGLDGRIVVIMGAGLIGLTAAAMAADRGARVVVSDPDPARRDLASGFGATLTTDPASLAGLLARQDDEAGVVLEASGSSRAVASALDVVGVGGVVVLVGSVFGSQPVPVVPQTVVRRLLTVRGVHNYAPSDLVGAAAYLSSRGDAYPFAGLVGETFGLSRLDDAIAAAPQVVLVGVVPD